MRVFEFKLKGKDKQYQAIDEAIKTAQFVRNKSLRYWMDNRGVNKYDLNKYCRIIALEFSFANDLNSTARQSSAERAWSSIARFFDNCKKKVKGKKADATPRRRKALWVAHQAGYPRFKKHSRSVEYKQSGWKLSSDRKKITFTDKKNIGTLKLKGTYDLHYYDIKQIKRVRIVRRADGYYAQFCIDAKVTIDTKPTGKAIGLDVGIKCFLADSNGEKIENPKFYRKSEK